jgi:hypothetical protein
VSEDCNAGEVLRAAIAIATAGACGAFRLEVAVWTRHYGPTSDLFGVNQAESGTS